MKQELEYIWQCETCQKNKITQNKTKMPMKITTTPEVVWEKCALDIVGPLSQTSDGNQYILTFQDELSKYTLAIPIEQQNARTVAKAFVEAVLKFRIPQTILTTKAPTLGMRFLLIFANLWKLKYKMHGIPSSDERSSWTYTSCTSWVPQKHILEDQSNWDKWLPYATFVFNTTRHTTTQFTPHELLFGRRPNIRGLLQKEPPETQYTYDNYIRELQSRLKSSYEMARNNLKSQKERSKECHDKLVNTPLFSIGDKVLLHEEKIWRGKSAKLSPPWIGPMKLQTLTT